MQRVALALTALVPLLVTGGAAPDWQPNGVPRALSFHRHSGTPPAALPSDPAPASPASWRTYSGTPIDVLTYHYDALRTGWNPGETDLTPASVSSGQFGLLTTLGVDGNVFAEPLLVSGFTMPDGSVHDVLVVTTGHNSVYAFDAQSYALLWQVSLGTPQSTNDVGCGDVQPEYGISSTPVILRSGAGSATIYLIAATEPAPYSFHTQLHALDLGTGQDTLPPVEIAPVAGKNNALKFEPQNQWSRAGLAYGNGSIYIGIGSHCDQTSSTGFLLRYDPSLNRLSTFHTESPSDLYLGSIWMSGFAPAIAASGNVFVVTGNGDFQRVSGANSWAMSVLGLPPTLLGVATSFTPAAYQSLSNNDTDFGSGGIMLLPPLSGSSPLVALTVGKSGTAYLLNQAHLGGLTASDAGPLDQKWIGGGVWGGPAYYGSPQGPVVYVQGDGSHLQAYSVSTGAHPRLSLLAQGTSPAGYGGALMAVSSNGSQAGTGIVWLARRGATVQLEAYDALALGNPIYAANAGVWSNTSYGNSFVTPMEANGRVYVPAYKTVSVFGLSN